MSAGICGEARFFLISVLTGSGILFFYSLLRGLRRELPRGALRLGIEDFLYWTCAGVAFFLVTFWENSGRVRGFSVLGLGIGMVLYDYLLDRLVVLAFAGLCHILFAPFRWGAEKIRTFLRKTLKKCGKRVTMTVRSLKGKQAGRVKNERKKKTQK